MKFLGVPATRAFHWSIVMRSPLSVTVPGVFVVVLAVVPSVKGPVGVVYVIPVVAVVVPAVTLVLVVALVVPDVLALVEVTEAEVIFVSVVMVVDPFTVPVLLQDAIMDMHIQTIRRSEKIFFIMFLLYCI